MESRTKSSASPARPPLLPRANSCTRGSTCPKKTDVFLPLRFSVAQEQGAFQTGFLLIARLKPGVTPASAGAELDGSLASFGMWNFAPGRYWTIVQPLQSALVGDTRQALWLLIVGRRVLTPDLPASTSQTSVSGARCSERGNLPFAWLLARASAI